MKRFWIGRVIGIICMVIIGIIVFSGIVMLLWNALLPQLFHFPPISWLQALGLLILCKILFGSFRGPGGHRKQEFREKMKAKWMNMSPEEREKFRSRWGRTCTQDFEPTGRTGNPAGTNPSAEEPA